MNVLVFIVNYHSDFALKDCLQSLRTASALFSIYLEIHVLDNSEYSNDDLSSLKKMLSQFDDCRIKLHIANQNTGYFGGMQLAQALSRNYPFDVVIYSNPDVNFTNNFFSQLDISRKNIKGMIAPSIISKRDGFDQNPKYINKLAVSKLRRLKIIYSTRISFVIFMGLALISERLFKKRKLKSRNQNELIYAPHGSVLIFTDLEFFVRLPSYPCFLFGEELFLAEESLKNNIPIIYDPKLIINDLRSQSISKLPGEMHRRHMLSSIDFILTNYYK